MSARKTAARKRRGWKPKEVVTLKAANKRRESVKKIAKRLKRSEGAVRQKSFAIGSSRFTF